MNVMIPYKRDFVTLNKSVINYLPRCSYHLLYFDYFPFLFLQFGFQITELLRNYPTRNKNFLVVSCMTVVYFARLLGAARTQILVELLFSAVFNLFCSFQTIFSDFTPEINKKRLCYPTWGAHFHFLFFILDVVPS